MVTTYEVLNLIISFGSLLIAGFLLTVTIIGLTKRK